MTNIAWRRGVLLLSILTLLRLLNLYLSLHVGLFDHLHLQKKTTVITAPARYYATVCIAHIPALLVSCYTVSSRHSRCHGDSP